MIVIDKDLMVPTADGVRLATDVFRLQDGPPSPVLLVRTPYGKDQMTIGGSESFDILRAVQAGYVAVAQDVRGRYGSEGEFEPNVNETRDGVDMIAWAAGQPWSSGVVGTFGGSYLGGTQWLPARRNPPALKAMAPAVTFSDMHEGCSYQGGANVLHSLRWVVEDIAPAEFRRRAAQNPTAAPPADVELDLYITLNELPLGSNPLIGDAAPFYLERLAHPTPGDYWLAISPNSGYEQITAPALNIGGWYDLFQWGTLQNFQNMRRRGGGQLARAQQRVIIGPWTHTDFSGSFSDRDFGPTSSAAAIDLPGVQLRWFDRWLRGTENGIDSEPPVMIFVMGIDQWRTETDWPLPDTQYRPYYMHSAGAANSLRGDGSLTTSPPADEPSDVYLFNPLRPVPSVGGQLLLPGASSMGPRDQREVEVRDDVLVYSTPVLEQPIEVTGPIELRLWASSSAPDTDFTGKLVDVHPDGRAIILTDGILRARYRNSLNAPEPMEPSTPYELSLNLWATANVFLPGHRIRLEVASSNFPKFDRNSNTGGDITSETADQYQPAVNRILHDKDHPSRLILPIIER